MTATDALIFDLACILGIAGVMTLACRRMGLSAIVGYLIAGAIVGPHTDVPILVDAERLHTLSELGVVLVMFVVGLELSVSQLLRVVPVAGLAATVQIGGMFWAGQVLGLALGWGERGAVFLGAMVAISSTMVVSRALEEHPVEERVRERVFGVLIVQDVIAIVLLTLLSTWVQGTAPGSEGLGQVLAELGAFVVITGVLGLLVIPMILRFVVAQRGSDSLTVVPIAVCFGFAALAAAFDYSLALGAFLGGAVAAESGHAHIFAKRVAPLRDVFAAVFFVSIGTLLDFELVPAALPSIAIVTLLVIVGQTSLVTIGSLLSGGDLHTAIRSGLCLSQIGEFSFIIAGIGTAAGFLDPSMSVSAIGVVALTSATTPLLVRNSDAIADILERRLPGPVQTLLALYSTWLASLSKPANNTARARILRLVTWMLVDALLIVIVVAAAALIAPHATQRLVEAAWEERTSRLLPYAVGLVIASPFMLGLIRAAQRLGEIVAFAVLPRAPATRTDLGASPRGAFVVAIELGVAVVIGLPMVAITQPFLPPALAFVALIVLVAALLWSLWRRSTELDAHVRAGSEVVLEFLRRGEGDSHAPHEPTTPTLEQLLPGIGEIARLTVTPESRFLGEVSALARLEHRAGVKVLALGRNGEFSVAPGSDTVLEAGDQLVVAGTPEACAHAASLAHGTPERAEQCEVRPNGEIDVMDAP